MKLALTSKNPSPSRYHRGSVVISSPAESIVSPEVVLVYTPSDADLDVLGPECTVKQSDVRLQNRLHDGSVNVPVEPALEVELSIALTHTCMWSGRM